MPLTELNTNSSHSRSRKSLPVKNNRPHKKPRSTDNLDKKPCTKDLCPATNKENAIHPKPGSKRKSCESYLAPGWVRNYHKDFDPNIEIRRAKERYELYQKKDWFNHGILCDEEIKDLSNYESKLRRKEKSDENTEKKVVELQRRQRDIDISKISEIYAKYIFEVPKPVREAYHPRTPNKFLKMSRRAWDGQIKRWRRHLHNYMDKDFSSTQAMSGRSSVSGTSTEFSFSMSDDLPELIDNNCSEFVFESVPIQEDEDTLQGNKKEISPAKAVVQQDALHSGLSNDIKYFDFENEDTICSPFKKTKKA